MCIFQSKVLLFECAETDFNPEYLSKFTIDVAADNASFNSDLIFIKNITEPIWNNLKIDMKPTNISNYRTIFNFDMNVCDSLGKQGTADKSNMISQWLQNILKYSDLPKSCPVLQVIYRNILFIYKCRSYLNVSYF